MKKLTFIFAFVMLALLLQCKKQENGSTDTSQNSIRMVLTANNGGSKTSFGANGSVSWNTNEKVFVVCDGQCVGYVTNGTEGGNTFTGTLTGITESGTYNFHYYYVGNTQTIADEATSFTMDFSKQNGTLANLGDFHVGHGMQNNVEVTYGETVTTQATMQTLVAMAYFNTTGMAETGEKVYLYGEKINNTLTIDFSNNAVTYGKSNGGWICAGPVSSGVYVMLVPNDGSTTDITFASKRTIGTCNNVFNYGISAGKFYCTEGNTTNPINVTVETYTQGLLRGQFIVNSSDNKKVKFSQGNLQYIGSASTPYWKFADNQYDWIGAQTPQNTTATNIDRDLFGWGTSGLTYDHGNGMVQAIAYQPYSTSTNNTDYVAYGSTNDDLNSFWDYHEADWGYNAIANGGNTQNSGWRTMTSDDWGWAIYKNSYGYGRVNNVRGVILLPYNWSTDYASLCSDFTIGVSASWPNVFNDNTTPTWSQMEAAGCVFLPAAGYRDGISTLNTANQWGYYWSDTYKDVDYSKGLIILTNRLYTNSFYRYRGASVRLVKY